MNKDAVDELPQAPHKEFIALRLPAKSPTAEISAEPSLFTPPGQQQRRRQSQRIRFRHPQYPDANNVLLDLFAPDYSLGGIQYSFAHVACGIIANNRWDGAFSETRDGSLLSCEPDEILSNPNYYYHIKDQTGTVEPYPIVPTFREWSFPHDNLPEPWASLAASLIDIPAPNRTHAVSSLYPALLSRDVSCRMSACEEGTQAAHIVPQAEDDWFQRNQMSLYNFNPVVIGTRSLDDSANALLLRADLHLLFDMGKFVFVPKSNAAAAPQQKQSPPPELVAHLLVRSKELHTLYHNTRLHPIGTVPVEFFFARFAWAIFPNLAPFLQRGVDRKLTGTTITTDDNIGSRWISAQECQRFGNKPPKSRSQSPQKRTTIYDDGWEAETVYEDTSEVSPPLHKRQRHLTSSNKREPENQQSHDPASVPEITKSADESDARHLHDNLEAIKQQWLEQERLKSDPRNGWEKEQIWAAKIRQNNSILDSLEAKRLYRSWGYDILSDDDKVDDDDGSTC